MKTINYDITEADWNYYLSLSIGDFIDELKFALKNGRRKVLYLDKLLYNFAFDFSSIYYSQKCADTYHVLYRARIYYKENDNEPNKDANSCFQGYNAKDSFVPPKELALEGRANKKGTVYLYTATNFNTAVAEVNPLVSNIVSVAEIKPIAPIHIFNLALWNIGLETSAKDKNDWIDSLLLELSQCFSSVNTKKSDYILCQYICNRVRKFGFDGISYYSSKNKSNIDENAGINIAVFNYEKCQVVSSKLVYINNINIDYCAISR